MRREDKKSMKHTLKSKTLMSLIFLVFALCLTACGKTNTEQVVKTESSNESKEAEQEKQVLNYQKIHREQVKKLKYPNDYEPWDYVAQEIVGNERTFYTDGHLVNMPNYIGEWEELLGVKFIEIPEFFGGGSENYTHNRVYVLDENYVEYTFKINTESYEPKDNLEEELEQLRKTETLGFEIHYAENWKHNLSLKDYISLLPDRNIFTDDVETVNNELAELYGVEMEPLGSDGTGYHLLVDNFDKGFTVDWECTQDGKARHLDIEYTPMPYLAYYKFINEEIPGYYDEDIEFRLEDVTYMDTTEEIQFELIDVSDDGINEIVIFTINGINIVYYENETGKLRQNGINSSSENITIYGTLVESGYLYEDGSYDHYSPDDAIYIDTSYSILGKEGLEQLAYIQECKTHGEYFINGKLATEEQVRECKTKYGAVNISFNTHTKEEVLEMIKQDSDLIYAGIGMHKQKQKDGEHIIEPYDDSALEEITFDESKKPLVQLLMDIVNGYVYLSEFLVADYCNETSAFTLMDLNGDGEQELLTCLSSYDGEMSYPTIYVQNADGMYEGIGEISGYIPETGEMITYTGSAFASMEVYSFDGQALNLTKKILSGENMEGMVYEITEDGIERQVSEEEFYREFNTYENRMQAIKGELLTIENIEKALGVKVCGNGKIIRDAE